MKQLKDYIQGERHGREINRLEREAMRDPLLEDALEGFDAVDDPSHAHRIERLRNSFSARAVKPRRRRFHQVAIWSSAAAVVVIVLGVTWLIRIQPSNQPSENYLATMTENEMSQREIIVPEIEYPEDIEFKQYDQQQNDEPTDIPSLEVKMDDTPETPAIIFHDSADNLDITSSDAKIAVEDVISADTKERPSSTETKGSKTEVEKEEFLILEMASAAKEESISKEEPPLSITAPQHKKDKVAASQRGRERVAASQSKKEEVVAYHDRAEGIAASQQRIEDIEEITVVGYGSQKRHSDAKSENLAVEIDKLISPSKSEPKKGWKSLQRYIQKNLKTPKDPLGKPYTGTVIIEFAIDSTGRPHNITVPGSLNPECDREAIRIITEGPSWRSKDTLRVKLGIKFAE